MWTLIVLYILGLNICQANGKDKSTQVYYVKLTIEESAIPNVTEKLVPFVKNTNLTVEDLNITTVCQEVQGGTECECEPNFKWSDKVCQSNPECCYKRKCIFNSGSASMCVSDGAVTINGSIALTGTRYHNCLKENEESKACNDELLKEMKGVYSTLTGFDSLTIQQYRVGSVIADFEMTIAYKFKQQDFINKSRKLGKLLNGSLDLETSGVVTLNMPPSPVCNSHKPNLTCTTSEDLNTQPVWEHKGREGAVFRIFSGTESEVTNETPNTNVRLKHISELWEGEFTCVYKQQADSHIISHKASVVLDLSLLPNIVITTAPAFPRCTDSSAILNVKVKCEIANTNENYTVTWEAKNIFGEITPDGFEEAGNKRIYVADAFIACKVGPTPQLTCTFENRCNETQTASTNVSIIYEKDQFCPAEGEWEITKAGSFAVLKCRTESGQWKRECKLGATQATWGPEVSECVNKMVNRVLQSANAADIGLGSLDENAANVFSLFENVTQNSETINTFANMNASVEVLSSMSQKLNNISDEAATNNFLNSSSHLLESSLNESWTSKSNRSNISLAQRYLTSVGQLVQVTNITCVRAKKNIEVASSNCTEGSKCRHKVFNNTVDLSSPDHGNIKTAAFKGLEMYLPNKEEDFCPNSIVVSTQVSTDEGNQSRRSSDSVTVTINFQLLQGRPRHHMMKCVSWDDITESWEKTCDWGGAGIEGQCKCNALALSLSRLSSFAILMSRYPEKIPGLTEVSYVGLSISVVSLVISLVIELVVWTAVVKTKNLYMRHTAHVNISLCLLIADGCFLASSYPKGISDMWCQVSVVLKHYCYLSMFFWMLCLSSMLLHQTVFPFHNFGKKTYLKLSLLLGYVCPLLIVVITFLCNNGGAKDVYFSRETCWLVYIGVMEGSIHTFVIPVGIIVIFNVFSMAVVIMKLLDHPKNVERSNDKEKQAAITVMRSVVLLTPIFGVTWILGFALMLLDLTIGNVAIAVNYAFTVMNAFQGFFILLATCLGDKLTREALMKRLKKNASASTSTTTTDSTIKLDSAWKK